MEDNTADQHTGHGEIGTNSVIARLLGAGRTKEAGEAATQGLLLSLLHGILIWLLGWLAVSHFLHMFTDESQTLRFGLQYSMMERAVMAFSLMRATKMLSTIL